MASIVLERLPPHDYLPDCASLPPDYGSVSWDDRPEVLAIGYPGWVPWARGLHD